MYMCLQNKIEFSILDGTVIVNWLSKYTRGKISSLRKPMVDGNEFDSPILKKSILYVE